MNDQPNITTLSIRGLGILNCILGGVSHDGFLVFIGLAMVWGSLYADARRVRQPEKQSHTVYKEM